MNQYVVTVVGNRRNKKEAIMNKRIRINGNLYESLDEHSIDASDWEDDFNDIWKEFKNLSQRINREVKTSELTPKQKKLAKELSDHLDEVNFAMGDVLLDLQMFS